MLCCADRFARRLRLRLLAAAIVLVAPAAASAQVMQGAWVELSQKRIEEHRQVSLRLLVLDASGQPAPGAAVRIEQQRHAFAVGVAVGQAGRPRPAPPLSAAAAPVYRCFNAVDLGSLSGWPRLEPRPGTAWDAALIDQEIDAAHARGQTVRWGTLISADPGRVPDWVVPLQGEELARELSGYTQRFLAGYGRHVEQVDLYGAALDHSLVEGRLGMAMVRRLFEQAKAAAPRATLCVRYHDAAEGERLHAMLQQVAALRQALVPVDALALDLRLGGTLTQAPLARTIDWIAGLGLPVMICDLEVGGPSPAAAALNLEIVLRLLFAEPRVGGIWFAGVSAEQFNDPAAALIDDDGRATPAGDLLDRLMRGLWWTDLHLDADALGNVRSRVFAGHYELSATLPDGTHAQTVAWLPPGPGEHLVILQPLKSDRP